MAEKNTLEPAKKQFGVRHISLGGAALIAMALVVLVFLLRSGNLENFARTYVNRQLALNSNVRLRWKAVLRNPLQSVDVSGLVVEVRDRRGWHTFLEADRVRMNAGIPQLLKAARLEVQLQGGRLYLDYDLTGTPVLPQFRPSGGGKGALEVARLVVRDARVFTIHGRDTVLWARSIRGSGSVELAEHIRISVDTLSGFVPPRSLAVQGLTARLENDPRGWHWRATHAWGPGFGLRTSGRFLAASDYELDARLDSLNAVGLRSWVSDSLPEGTFTGQVNLKSRASALDFSISGKVSNRSTGAREFLAEGRRVGAETRFRRAQVKLDAGIVDLSGMVSDAGHASGRWSTPGFDLARAPFLPPGFQEPAVRLIGSGELKLEWDRRGLRTMGGTVSLTELLFRGQRFRKLDTAFSYQGGTWSVQGFTVQADAGQLRGEASLDHDQTLSGKGEVLADLARLAPPRDSLEGRVRGEWDLSGALKHPVVRGRLELSQAHLKELSVESGLATFTWHGPEWEGLAGVLTLRGVVLGDVRVPQASLEASAGRSILYRLSAIAGDSQFVARGSLNFKDGAATVDSARLAFGRKRWNQSGQTRLQWNGGPIRWQGVDWISPDGDSVSSSGTYDPRTEAIQARLDASGWALGPLTEHFLKQEAPQGRLSGKVEIRGTLSRPEVLMDAAVDGALVRGHVLDLLRVRGSLTGGELLLQDFRVTRGGAEIRGNGRLVLPEFRDHGLHALDQGRPPVLRGGTLKGSLDLHGLDLSELGEFSDTLKYLNGIVSGRITLEGPVSSPMARGSFDGDSVVYHEFQAGRVHLAATYEQESLRVDTLQSDLGGARVRAQGHVPAVLSLEPFKFGLLRDREMRFTAAVEHVDLQLADILFLHDFLAYSNGHFSLSAEVAGTLDKPRLKGQATIEDATLRPFGREEVFRAVTAHLALDGQTVRLADFKAETGRKGSITGSGTVILGVGGLTSYHFDVSAQEAVITDQENYSLVVSGDLRIDPRNPGLRDPLVTGHLIVQQGLLLMEFGKTSPTLEPTSEKPLFRWYYDLAVTVPSDLWWRNDQANIEVAGEMRAFNLDGSDLGQGSFEIRRGSFDVADASFRISSGTVTFNGPVIDPMLSLTAETQSGGQKIQLAIPGCRVSQLNDPKNLVLSSDALGSSQAEILRNLTVGRLGVTSDAQSPDFKTGTFGVAKDLAINRIQRMLERSAAGFVDVVDVSSAKEGNEEYTLVGVGKYVGPDLFVRYAQGLGATTDRELSVEWRLNRIFLVRGESRRRISTSGSVNSTDSENNLDLKMRLTF